MPENVPADYPQEYNAQILRLFPEKERVWVGYEIAGMPWVTLVAVSGDFHPRVGCMCSVYPWPPIQHGDVSRIVCCAMDPSPMPGWRKRVAEESDG